MVSRPLSAVFFPGENLKFAGTTYVRPFVPLGPDPMLLPQQSLARRLLAFLSNYLCCARMFCE